ncbi:ABC transporter ATP-binding protein [Paenibacillus marinisediminis]
MLEVQDVSKWFENQRGVQNIDFTMERGEIIGFLGPNGAGKTTTMRLITGYLLPTSGTIRIDGISMSEDTHRVRSKIGYLPETPPLYPDMSVHAYLRFVADLRDVSAREQKMRIEEMVDMLGLHGRERQLIRSLSKGYKQRLGLAQAIIHKPELLILDEPTSGLDPNQISEIRNLIRELGEQHTVLLSTHILPEVNSLCNRVIIINQGKLVLDEKPDRLGDVMGQAAGVSLEVKGPAEQVITCIGGIPEVEEVIFDKHTQASDDLSEVEDTEQEQHKTEIQDHIEPEQDSEAESSASSQDHAAVDSDTVHVRVKAKEGLDIRESLFYAMAEVGYPILEMKSEKTSLEEVFQRLTTEEVIDDEAV